MTQKQEVIIDLTLPLTIAHSRNKEANLQRHALEQVNQLLIKFIEYNQSDNKLDNTFILPRQNNTIYINGERGAGKTTFLLDVLKEYQETKIEANTIVPIAFIDPTLIQTNQNILIEIISALYKKTNSHLSCGKDEEKKRELNQSLEKMSEGLKLLDIHNKNPKYQDSSWYLNKSLQDSTSGQCLEKNLHDFIDKCAELFKAELFVIAIDDVDTKTDKAYEVLEVIRCYLTHPKLSIIISGDLELYSHLVNNKKIEEISSENIKDYEDNKEMANHLEQQYLSKILPIEQRITLSKMNDILESSDVFIKYNLYDEENKNLITIDKKNCLDVFRELISSALSLPQNQINSYKTFIFHQPIRSILQFFKSIIDKSKSKHNNIVVVPTVVKDALSNIFLGNLSTNIKLSNLSSYSPEISTVAYELFKVLEKNNDLETGFYCRTDGNLGNIGFSASKFYITATCSETLSNNTYSLSNALKLMLTFGGSANIYTNFVLANLADKKTYLDYLDYISLSRNESVTNLASHFSPIVLDQYESSSTKKSTKIGTVAGVIRLPRANSPTKQFHESNFNTAFNKTSLSKHNRIPNIGQLENSYKSEENQSIFDYIAIQTILLSSQSAIKIRGTEDYVSAYSLLASIAELLTVNKDHTSSINEVYNKCKITQNYTYPHFLNGREQGDPDDIEAEYTQDAPNPLFPIQEFILTNLLEDWLKSIPTNVNTNTLMLGKIWTRIHYSLIKSSEDVASTKKDKDSLLLADLFSRFVWSIINSTLIEECRYSKVIAEIDTLDEKGLITNLRTAHNINKDPSKLVENINKLYLKGSILEKKEKSFAELFPITDALIKCPLFWPFLYNDKSLKLYSELLAHKILDINGYLHNFFEAHKEEIDNLNPTEFLGTGSKKVRTNKTTEEVIKMLLGKSFPKFNDFTISRLPIMGCFRDPTGKSGKTDDTGPKE